MYLQVRRWCPAAQQGIAKSQSDLGTANERAHFNTSHAHVTVQRPPHTCRQHRLYFCSPAETQCTKRHTNDIRVLRVRRVLGRRGAIDAAAEQGQERGVMKRLACCRVKNCE